MAVNDDNTRLLIYVLIGITFLSLCFSGFVLLKYAGGFNAGAASTLAKVVNIELKLGKMQKDYNIEMKKHEMEMKKLNIKEMK